MVSSVTTILIFVLLLGYLSFRVARTGVRYEVNQRNSTLAALVAQDINAQFNAIWGHIRLFAYQLETAAEMLPLQARAMLELRLAWPLTYRAVYLFDQDRTLLLHVGDTLETLLAIKDVQEILDRAPIPLTAEVMAACEAAQAGQVFLSPTYIIGVDHIPVIYMGVPVWSRQGELTQILVAEIDLRDIWRRIDEINVGQTGRGFVVAQDGTVIAHPDRTYIGQPVAPELLRVLEGYEGQTEYTDPRSGRIMLASYSPVGGQSAWGIVIEQEGDEAFATVNSIALITSFVLLVGVGMAALITIVIARGITSPIQQLVAVTRAIADTGDLSQDVVIQSQDEVGQLAITFNQMIASLRVAKEEIASYSHTLETQVQQRTQELERAYLDLTKQHQTLEVILRSIADGLVVIGGDERILLNNTVIAEFLKRPTETLIGQNVWDVLPSPALQQVVRHAFTTPETVSTADVVLPQGTVLRTSVGVLPNIGGQARGIVLVLRNVTHELDVDRMKTEFVSMVSHELRTPLTSVLGFARLMQKQFKRDIVPALPASERSARRAAQRIEGNLNIITSEGERLSRLIADVLDIAKMESGSIEWERVEVNIPEVIEQAVAATRSLAQEKKLSLRVTTNDNIPSLMADHDRLVQVVTNLLSNAIKYTDEGEVHIHVWSLAPGNEIAPFGPRDPNAQPPLPATVPLIAVSVQDTGVGIAENDLPNVFEKFKQVGDRAAGTRRPGTGLGLPICREIVAYHQGHIWVESCFGKGSRFVFVLPCEE
ncbi:MAG: HAMP domain-containing protein [Anaerolineae bacterium]|nr:HAMP domain-containing protein [Anaerolineae bacterium]